MHGALEPLDYEFTGPVQGLDGNAPRPITSQYSHRMPRKGGEKWGIFGTVRCCLYVVACVPGILGLSWTPELP